MKETVTVIKCDHCFSPIEKDNPSAIILKPVYRKIQYNQTIDIEPLTCILMGNKSVDLSSRDFCNKQCMLDYLGNMIDKMVN